MELGKHIKKYRSENSLSQEQLAERVFVSRQTISNWENDKSYPDVNSLVLLSEVFNTSIDNLIKGDVKIMKKQIKEDDKKEFEKLGNIFAVLMIITVVSPIPLTRFLGYVGIAIWIILMFVTMYVAIVVEKKKKQFDIQTYREIISFTEGTGLDEISKAREEGKRKYQKILLGVGSGIIALAIAAFWGFVLNII
jgi:transcriptional regulator with XRE-family HTH domain